MLPIVTRTTTGGKDSAGRCAFKLYWEAYEGILKQKTKCKQKCQEMHWIIRSYMHIVSGCFVDITTGTVAGYRYHARYRYRYLPDIRKGLISG